MVSLKLWLVSKSANLTYTLIQTQKHVKIDHIVLAEGSTYDTIDMVVASRYIPDFQLESDLPLRKFSMTLPLTFSVHAMALSNAMLQVCNTEVFFFFSQSSG